MNKPNDPSDIVMSKSNDLSKILEDFHINEEKEIGDKFKAIMEEIPEHFTQWEKWFKPVYLNSSWKKHYQEEINVKQVGDLAKNLIHYAITPLAFMSALHGVELLLKKPPTGAFRGEGFIDESIKMKFIIEDKPYTISVNDFSCHMDSTLPNENRSPMVLWILAVLEYKSDLVPKFLITKNNDQFIVKKIPTQPIVAPSSHEIKIHQIPVKRTHYQPYKKPHKPFLSRLPEGIIMPLYTAWLLLFMMYIFVTTPVFLAYSSVTYTIGKWWWHIHGEKNKV